VKSFLRDFGAWVAIAGILAAGLVGYGALGARVDSHEQRLGKVEPDTQQNKTDIAVVRANTDSLVKAVDRIEEHLGTKR
jgi:hypothetical protein